MANRRRSFARAGGLPSFALRLAFYCLLAIVLQFQSPRVSGAGHPQIEQPVLAVIHGRPALGQPVSEPLVIRGLGFGFRGASSRLEFVYGGGTVSVAAGDAAVKEWNDNEIRVDVPDEVGTGTIRVIADGQPSTPVDLLVYEYDSIPIPWPDTNTDAYGLALAVARDGKIWMNREFRRSLQEFDPQSRSFVKLSIPQIDKGIFAIVVSRPDDVRTRNSELGEDVEVDSQGNVWFTEGGALYYPGRGNQYDYKVTCDINQDTDCQYCPWDPLSTCKTATAQWYNTSRVVKYDPTNGQFSCFNSPIDNSMVQGVLVDKRRGIVWYAEGGLAGDSNGTPSGNAITGITMNSTLSNCLFDPYDPNQKRDELCGNGPSDNCHWRFPLSVQGRSPAHLAVNALDPEGNIWFTEYWGARIGRLNPTTGRIIELPLPPTINTNPDRAPLWVGSGPWDLDFDSDGNLWVTEYMDATILKIDPSLMATNDCLNLDVNHQNPCVTEVYRGLNYPAQDAYIHTLDIAPDGKVWFVLSKDKQTIGSEETNATGQVGFVDPTHNGETILLPILKSQYGSSGNVVVDGIGAVSGVVVHGDDIYDVYLMESSERQLGHLRLDLCPLNEYIGNGVGIRGEDGTVPNGDALDHACDDDWDNDGISNSSDSDPGGDITYDDNRDGVWKGPGDDGPSWDANADGRLDGWVGGCGSTAVDSDSDGLANAWENCKWGTNPTAIDSDGDGLRDCREAADVNGDGTLNLCGDVMAFASAVLTGPSQFGQDGDFDINGDGRINLADLIIEAKLALFPGLCR